MTQHSAIHFRSEAMKLELFKYTLTLPLSPHVIMHTLTSPPQPPYQLAPLCRWLPRGRGQPASTREPLLPPVLAPPPRARLCPRPKDDHYFLNNHLSGLTPDREREL